MQDIRNLNNDEWAVIDMDSGTVLGTNLVLVRAGFIDECVLSSDFAAFDCGETFGLPIYTSRCWE